MLELSRGWSRSLYTFSVLNSTSISTGRNYSDRMGSTSVLPKMCSYHVMGYTPRAMKWIKSVLVMLTAALCSLSLQSFLKISTNIWHYQGPNLAMDPQHLGLLWSMYKEQDIEGSSGDTHLRLEICSPITRQEEFDVDHDYLTEESMRHLSVSAFTSPPHSLKCGFPPRPASRIMSLITQGHWPIALWGMNPSNTSSPHDPQ